MSGRSVDDVDKCTLNMDELILIQTCMLLPPKLMSPQISSIQYQKADSVTQHHPNPSPPGRAC